MSPGNNARGEFYSKRRAKQVASFSGFQYGSITPTDIDAVIEYKNLAYLWFEVKMCGACVPRGQRLALERLVVDLGKTKPTIAIVCEHNEQDTRACPVLATCNVRELFLSSFPIWQTPKWPITAKEAADRFIDHICR